LTQAHPKIGRLHHVGGGNLGNDATLHAVAENIKGRWRNAEIVALSMNPSDAETRHGIISHPARRKGDFHPQLLAEKFASMVNNAEQIKSRMSASGWPLEYWGLEPFRGDRSDWRFRYAAAFQIGETQAAGSAPESQSCDCQDQAAALAELW